MENYIHPDAIAEAYRANGIEVTLPATFGDFDDVPQIVAQALHAASSPSPWDDLSEEKQKKKISKAKKVINGEAARRMTVVRLNECGGYNEVLAWLQNIDNLTDA